VSQRDRLRVPVPSFDQHAAGEKLPGVCFHFVARFDDGLVKFGKLRRKINVGTMQFHPCVFPAFPENQVVRFGENDHARKRKGIWDGWRDEEFEGDKGPS
jgi:hypothetical protein